jgi:hypothetical protein
MRSFMLSTTARFASETGSGSSPGGEAASAGSDTRRDGHGPQGANPVPKPGPAGLGSGPDAASSGTGGARSGGPSRTGQGAGAKADPEDMQPADPGQADLRNPKSAGAE